MQAGHEIGIITVAREYGAGGGELARGLGERLGWRLIDHALIEQVAARLGASVEAVEGLDEHVGGILERLGNVFARGGPEQLFEPAVPDPDVIARVERSVIRTAAQSPPVILVGHGAQCVLRQRPEVLHVRLIAPFEIRAARAAEARGIDLQAARAEARRADVERHRYVRHHFQCEWDDPHLYDLQVNTGAIGADEVLEMILGMVDRRRARAAE